MCTHIRFQSGLYQFLSVTLGNLVALHPFYFYICKWNRVNICVVCTALPEQHLFWKEFSSGALCGGRQTSRGLGEKRPEEPSVTQQKGQIQVWNLPLPAGLYSRPTLPSGNKISLLKSIDGWGGIQVLVFQVSSAHGFGQFTMQANKLLLHTYPTSLSSPLPPSLPSWDS